MNNINHLLQQVSIISRKYDEIAKLTGENFNIFSVMSMEHNEVYTHSAIIGELLNPNGSHGQGAVFLNLFVDYIKEFFTSEKHTIGLNYFDTLVNDKICERTISIENNWKNVTGGRIDIIIEDQNQIMLIENKIYAIDQPYQLIRYKNYAETKRSKNAFLFYLTLDGKELKEQEDSYFVQDDIQIAGSNFKFDKKKEYDEFKIKNEGLSNIHHCLYYPISFENDIKNWIEKCLERTYSLPTIRETLVQYLNLIKKLTNQTTNHIKTMEILEILKNNIQQSFEIARSIEPLKSKLYYDFFEEIIQYSNKREFTVDSTHLKSTRYFGLYLTPKEWNLKPYCIAVIFDTESTIDYSDLYVSLYYKENITDIEKIATQQKFPDNFQKNHANIWRNISTGNWANNPEIWEDVAKGQNSSTFKEIISTIEEIIEIEKS